MAKNINGKHIFKKNLYFLLQQSLNTSNVKVFGSQKNAKLRFEPQEKKSSFFPFACCLMVLPPHHFASDTGTAQNDFYVWCFHPCPTEKMGAM